MRTTQVINIKQIWLPSRLLKKLGNKLSVVHRGRLLNNPPTLAGGSSSSSR